LVVELMPTPSGVGQPRSACTIERIAAKVEPTACQPAALTMHPTARPSK
jgi:hypothetical protein